MLRLFARWFASPLGVWQTIAICGTAVVIEFMHPSLDQHGFWLLYWLTVYSAVTQNVLAYSNRLDTEQGEAILQELRSVLDSIATMEAAILEDTEDIQSDLDEVHPSKESK